VPRAQPHRSFFRVISSCLKIPYGVKSTAESRSNTPYRQLIAVAAGDRALNINRLFFEDNLTFFNLFSRIESPTTLFSSMIRRYLVPNYVNIRLYFLFSGMHAPSSTATHTPSSQISATFLPLLSSTQVSLLFCSSHKHPSDPSEYAISKFWKGE